MSERRLDQWLVDKKFASSRTKAQDLIAAGQVVLRRGERAEILKKASMSVPPDADIRLLEGAADRYASRAGLKLEGALRVTGLRVAGWLVLDVGQSTGGFTDCLLQQGVREIIGIDVGHGQLAEKLRGHAAVRCLEGINARELGSSNDVRAALGDRAPELIVADLSFISLAQVIPQFGTVGRAGTQLLSLVKPQFEVGPENLGKGGIVRDSLLYPEVERKIKTSLESAGWGVLAYFESPVPGREGNQEFFVHAIYK